MVHATLVHQNVKNVVELNVLFVMMATMYLQMVLYVFKIVSYLAINVLMITLQYVPSVSMDPLSTQQLTLAH